MNIDRLLKPKNLVVIGASEKEGFGGDTCRNVMAGMDESRYYFVNPKRDMLFGKKCYHSVSELPENVDLAVIATPAHTVKELLAECAEKGVRGAVVFASGYSEVGTAESIALEKELKELCDEKNIALMGPNCAGFVNFIHEVTPFAFITEERDRRGSVGVISQSGQLVLSMMDRPGATFSYMISSGNSKLVTIEDYMDFLVEDPDTNVVSVYLEGVRQPKKFMAVLKKAAEMGKPVVILKTGKSEKAQEIAASHTGSLSGSDKVFDALFEKYGVIRVDDLEELISVAQALATMQPLPNIGGVAAISLSGGETGITADLGERMGVDFAVFSETTNEELAKILPGYAQPNNPLDVTASLSYDIDRFSGALEIIMKDPGVELVAVGYTLLHEIADNAIYYMYEAMKKIHEEPWFKPMVMVPFVEMSRNEDYTAKLAEIGIPVLPTSLYAQKIISSIMKRAGYVTEDHCFPETHDKVAGGKETTTERKALSEVQSRDFMKQHGLAIGRYHLATTKAEAAEYFLALQNDQGTVKVAAKIDSPDILHKSDIGGVILNLASPEEVATAYDTIRERALSHCPDANILGVQIVPMAKPGAEMIIGVKNDPQFGPTILCGLGGVFVELFKDVSLALAPVSGKEAEKMIKSLTSFRLLDGYRGKPKYHVAALTELLVNLSELAYREKELISEFDINPVFVNEEGVEVADVLVVLK